MAGRRGALARGTGNARRPKISGIGLHAPLLGRRGALVRVTRHHAPARNSSGDRGIDVASAPWRRHDPIPEQRAPFDHFESAAHTRRFWAGEAPWLGSPATRFGRKPSGYRVT